MLLSLNPILPTRDIAGAAAFWSRLGFATTYRADAEYLMMERDGVEVHFSFSPAHDPLTTAASAYLRPSDIDALDTEWNALGLPGTGQPRFVAAENKPWGMRELALVDPDGNLIRAGQEILLG